MFASLELGKDEKDLNAGGLSLKKNPLLASIIDGCETLKGLTTKGQVTAPLLQAAKAIILLRTDKIGFGISVTQGYGIMLMRNATSASGWSAPLPLKVDGFSMGAVMGYSEQHTALLMSDDKEIQTFVTDKRSMKMGLDLGLSVGKKVNQNATVDTHTVQKNEEGDQTTRAFTLSKGYIVDVSLKGMSVEPDSDDMEAAYGEGTSPADVLQGRIRAPPQTQLLYNVIAAVQNGQLVAAPK